MTLPKVEVPTYELEVPSTDEKLKFRPFLVKEEKILLMALESKDNGEMINALKDLIKACTFEKFDPDKAPLFDLEYIFLRIRAKSVGETSTIRVRCDDNETFAEVDIPLEEVNVHVDEEHTNKIDITDKIKVIMDYPKVDITMPGDSEVESFFKVINSCIWQVVDGETVHERTEMTEAELDEFLGSLSNNHFKQFRRFFETMPRLKYELEYKQPKTGKTEKRTLEGMQSFF